MLASCLWLAFASASHGQFVESDANAVRVLQGNQVGDQFGWLAANIGDLTGDGIDESLVGAIAFDGFKGRAAVFSGSDGSLLHEQIGAPGTALGYAVDAAGDTNGDGFPDFIVGGGQILVISGADFQILHDFSAVTGFSDSVGGGGDLDGDGFDDLLVGTQSLGDGSGRAWAFSGRDGDLLWTRDGAEAGTLLGSAISAIDDIDGDGGADVVVGAVGAAKALVLRGRDGALLRTLRPTEPADASFYGGFFASDAGDVDGDGVGDIFVSDLDATVDGQASTGIAYVYSGRRGGYPIHVLRGRQAGEGFGLGRAIPDVNGDGRPDLLIGAYNNSRGAANAGAAYLYSGKSGALLRTVSSTTANDNFGGDATGAGDVDGDGLPDFLVTAPGLAFQGLDAGRAVVVAGTVLPCPADLTGDDRVDARDFLILKRSWFTGGDDGDLDADGDVDLSDALIMIKDLGRCAPGFPRG